MAEALIAGREAGHGDTFSNADNPYHERDHPDKHRAWNRGFWVGRSLDEQEPLTRHVNPE